MYYVAWWQYIKDLEALVIMISKSGKKFDKVVGIVRGGCIIAVYTSHQLGIPYSLRECILPNDKVLIVDDVSDTGVTLSPFKKDKNVTIATLHMKEGTSVVPDFYVKKIPKDVWIKYPYEKESES